MNNDGTDGHMAGALAIVRCEINQEVAVICVRSGTRISPTYGEQTTSAFAGILLELET